MLHSKRGSMTIKFIKNLRKPRAGNNKIDFREVNKQRTHTVRELEAGFVAFLSQALVASLVMLCHWDFMGKSAKLRNK